MTASRRDFLKTSAVAGTAAFLAANAHAQANNDVIRVGLIGCGGRGTGAAGQCLRGGQNVRLVAMADAFQDRLTSCLQRLQNDQAIRQNVDVPQERQFVGLDAYQRVIENCDLVLLATPPGFRPQHLQAAVAARKHIFTEKPVAVDGPGVRLCLELFEQANRNRLCIVAGLQRHYQTSYLEAMKRIHDGDIGNITAARCYWNQGQIWNRPRQQDWTDLVWQMRNWYYFTWLCGDHIVEQHVHNLDVVNWALRAHPVRCVGMGGRQVRTGPEFGNIFDHFAVDYEYPNGVHAMSLCRQTPGCENNVSEALAGARGNWTSTNQTITGERAWSFPRRGDNDPYQQEHVVLIEAIRAGRHINDLKNVAEASLTAIMGRMSAYTGKAVTWEQALNSRETLMPERLAWDMSLPVAPVAVPGRTELI